MCLFQPSWSSTNALIILQDPHSRFRKYWRELFDVPHDSNPVDITPGTMMTGCFAVTPCAERFNPTEKES